MADILTFGLSNPIGVPVATGRWPGIGGLLDTYDHTAVLAAVGGIGFQFQAGIVTVDAYSDRVDVTADRIITYTGQFNNVTGALFNITAPFVTIDGATLQIPINVFQASVASVKTPGAVSAIARAPEPVLPVLGGVDLYRDITIESIDRAIRDWFDKTVDARVLHADGSLRKVPVNFSQGERWSIGRTRGTFRDDNGVLILPIIGLRRTGIDPDNTQMALGTQVPSIQVSKLVDPKSNDIQNLEGLKPEQLRRKYPAIYDVYTIPFPNAVVVNYQLTVQAQYITQMNEILQKVWHELDLQRSFVAPFQNDGRHPPRANQFGEANPYEGPKRLNFPYVVGFIETNESAGDNFEEFTDQERVVKYTTEVRVPCVLQTTPDGEKPSVQVQRTAYKLVLKDENFTFVDDPDDLDAIFGKLR